MHPDYIDLIKRKIELAENEGPSKLMPLDKAIRRFIRPGMTLHLCVTHCRPNAASNELIRQFWGKKPGFTLAMVGMVANQIILAHGGLIKKVIATFCGDSYPTPGPSRIVQKAYREGTIQFEHWSIFTYPLRLLAGAMGVPWIPTRSISGSSMAAENKDSFIEIDDPSGSGAKMALIRALNPDISIVHGWCADEAGNILMTPPYGENVFGALAAKEGVIATVERIVPTGFIRKHAYLVKIPGYVVKSVSVAPMGAHPSGITNLGVPDLPAYAEDYDFIEELRNASRRDDTYDAWIKHWILDCKNQDDYLSRLGHQRIFYLRGKAAPESWRNELEDQSANLSVSNVANPTERMIVAAARMISRAVKERGHKTILAGVGASNLAAWLATISCKEGGMEVECMAEMGFYGYSPRPADPYIFNHRNIHTCKLLASIDTIMGILMGGAQNRCIGVLGAAQVDKFGNVNSTCIPTAKVFLVGSGGANDVASSASEVLVCLEQTRDRLLEKVSYITSPGKSVRMLVTDLAVWERPGSDGTFVLTAVLDDGSGRPLEKRLEDIVTNTGWEVKTADKVDVISQPTRDELLLLRMFDPKRLFIGPDPGKTEN